MPPAARPRSGAPRPGEPGGGFAQLELRDRVPMDFIGTIGEAQAPGAGVGANQKFIVDAGGAGIAPTTRA